MNHSDDLDRMLVSWLDDPYTPPAPHYLGRVLERTRRTRQRRAWASLERWLPMADKVLQPTTAKPLRPAWLLIIALLVLALVLGAVLVGTRLLTPSPVIPQGGAAVFAYDSNGDIFTVRADGTDVRQLTSGADRESAPSWSPDGTRIAYRRWKDAKDSVVIMDAGGGNTITLATTDQTRRDCVPYGMAAWAPDGSAIVFPTRSNSGSCEGPTDLFIVSTDGSSQAARLVAPGLSSASAAWSPDGTGIAFVGQDTATGSDLYVVDVGTSRASTGGLQARRITEADPGVVWKDPRWSPDGTEIAAASGTNDDCSAPYDAGALDVFIVKADGSGTRRQLAAETANEYLPTWSPDGRHLAFQSLVAESDWVNERPCTTATWVIDADGSNKHRLEGFGPDPVPPSWSPDGTRLAGALSEPGGLLGLYFVTVDGSSPLVIVDVNDDWVGGTWQPVTAPLPPAPSFAAQASMSS